MKANIVSIVIIVSFVFSACVKVAQDVEPPVVESQLVVFSFLSPEEKLVKVEVSRSKPVYGKGGGANSVINNAQVTITNDGGQSTTLVFVDTLGQYAVSKQAYPIEPGRTYTVKVLAGGKTVEGTCRVPADSIALTEWSVKSVAQPSSNYDGPYSIYTYKWRDQNSVTNYYRLDIEKVSTYGFSGDSTAYTQNVASTVWDDKNRDGVLLSGTSEDYSYNSDGGDVIIYLLNTDIHYFEYHRRRLNYFGDDPFSEPFQQYNNVQGGLGVVCAYRKTSRSLKIQ